MTAVMERQGSLEVLWMEECTAWAEYLGDLRLQSAVRYEDLEPWAWSRLQERLEAIRARRRALKVPARRTNAAEGDYGSPAGEPEQHS